MAIKRKGSAVWSGDLKSGGGTVSTESGVLQDQKYGFSSRFEDEPGTNPEELLGAAHAGCFTMALSLILSEAGLVADRMETTATVSLEKGDAGFHIPAIHLALEATVPNADDAQFQKLAAKAKENCPVSKLFNAQITLDARLT